MSREWKPRPGAVCLVRYADSDGPWVVGIATTPYGNWRTQEHGATRQIAEARPLVVIDPEDHEQAAALDRAISTAYSNAKWGSDRVEPMQAALRSLITPPKPDEPQGLGAVVEDQRGELWVRDKTTTTVNHWKRARGEDGGSRYPYSHIAAVRVLSEGVQP